MKWWQQANVEPTIYMRNNICNKLFADLYECQAKSPFPLRDCILFKEDYVECIDKVKQVQLKYKSDDLDETWFFNFSL